MSEPTVLIRAIADLPVILPNAGFACARLVAFEGVEHVALVFDRPESADPCDPMPVRVHSRCVTSESLGSCRCDCAQQLNAAKQCLAESGGVLIYMDDEGRGIGLAAKVHAYQMQDEGLDTFQANIALGYAPDQRDFSLAGAMLAALGITKVRLMTENRAKGEALSAQGIEVVEQVAIPIDENQLSDSGRRYVNTKRLVASHNRPMRKD
ncbi:MAG TPA: GTP cyclohydrolase II [Terracidiphilus sp.]|nr:GTP cyclohydrolase II [Terracidiphilus sp.]